MLQALTADGNFIILPHLKRKEIEKLKQKKQKFYCPSCKQPVLIRAGKYKMPHFAHYPQMKCSVERTGGEGPYHEKGKLLLYNWLRRQNYKVSLEMYLPNIQQRADILIRRHPRKLAIEFQTSRIPVEQVFERSTHYLRSNIQPLWILGFNLFRRLRKNRLRINAYTAQFIHQFFKSFPAKLYYFCPKSSKMIVASDLIGVKTQEVIAQIKSIPLQYLSLNELFQREFLHPSVIFRFWKEEKRRFRLFYSMQQSGAEKEWLEWLYVQRSHLHYLPAIVYLPVRNHYVMKTSPWNWQSRICLNILCKREVGSLFTVQECYQVVREHLYPPKQFPLTNSLNHPIQQYITHLIDLKYVERISQSTYRILRKIKTPNHIEEALKEDEYIIKQFENNLNSKRRIFESTDH